VWGSGLCVFVCVCVCVCVQSWCVCVCVCVCVCRTGVCVCVCAGLVCVCVCVQDWCVCKTLTHRRRTANTSTLELTSSLSLILLFNNFILSWPSLSWYWFMVVRGFEVKKVNAGKVI